MNAYAYVYTGDADTWKEKQVEQLIEMNCIRELVLLYL